MKTEIFDKLRNEMMDSYISVNKSKNPFAVNIDKLSADQIISLVAQYSIFPKNIVNFLFAAREQARKQNWKGVEAELTRNAGEELGTETNGITHYEMLITGLANELGYISAEDLRNTSPSSATKVFVDSMNKTLAEEKSGYSIGAVYALESSAVPELVIVKDLVNKLFGMKLGHEMKEGVLAEFFRLHLDIWEPGHEEGLRHACESMNDEFKNNFIEGFHDVMKVMDTWWLGLETEIIK